MSQEESNRPSPPTKSPGKGGKSLQLMQQRLLAQQHQQDQEPEQHGGSVAATQPPPPANMDSNAASISQQPQAVQQSAQPPSAAGGRPKGKDFAAMSARAPVRPPEAQDDPPSGAPPVTATPAPTAVVVPNNPGPPPSGKPKGKDFSAMASRLSSAVGAPAPQMPPARSPQVAPTVPTAMISSSGSSSLMATHGGPMTVAPSAEATRAAHLQASARAAAGLPPLDQPTATSVTIPPPPQTIVPNRSASTNGVPSYHPATTQTNAPATSTSIGWTVAASTAVASLAPDQLARGSVASRIGAMPQQQLQQQPQRRSSSGTGEAGSSATPMMPPGAGGAPPRPNNSSSSVASSVARTQAKALGPATTPPTMMEGRLSAGPQYAPLVGPRIQDIVRSLDPNYGIDSQAEEQVLQLADDFLDKVCKQSIRMAQHRSSKVVDVQDIQMVLAKQWNIVVPGLGPPIPRKTKVTPAASGAGTVVSSSSVSRSASGAGLSTNTSSNKRKSATTGSSSGATGSKSRKNNATVATAAT